MSQPEPAADAAPKKKKKPVVLIALVALFLLGGGGAAGAYFYMHRGPAAPPKPPEPGIVALDTFVVNLADPGGHRFVRVTLSLVLDSQAAANEMKENEVSRIRVRSSILEFLTMQTADRLVTPEGKAELKKAIAERASHALEHAKVVDVLFTEFVVQF
jgi:flagellar FliL protein